jgi:predicted DNA-binding transcriptional regulator AlpA
VSGELVGVAEIADILGVTRQRVHQLMRTRSDFPPPLAELAIGRVWDRKDIERWSQSLNRRRGPRRSGTAAPPSDSGRDSQPPDPT